MGKTGIVALTEIDRTLLHRCLQREPGAWKDFVDRFLGLFIHVAQHVAYTRSVQLSPADVDDLCADVLLKILENDFALLRRFRGKSSLATYLTVIARRIMVREITRRRQAEALGHVAAHQSSLDQAGSHVSAQERIENQEMVEQMLDNLSPKEREVVRQYHLDRKSYREISANLGIPENSIGATLSRARAKIRELHAGS